MFSELNNVDVLFRLGGPRLAKLFSRLAKLFFLFQFIKNKIKFVVVVGYKILPATVRSNR